MQMWWKTKIHALIPSNNESGDLNSDKSNIVKDKNKLRSLINFNKKKIYDNYAILALIIMKPFLYSHI